VSAIPKQRWGEVPGAEATAKWPVRNELVFWRQGDAARITAWFERQAFAAGIAPWLTARAAAYAARYDGETADRCRLEAQLDLFCWQRQFKAARPALEWLKGWEEAMETGNDPSSATAGKEASK
jgi:hypothetical protein